MPIHSLFLGFAKRTKDDLTEFYGLLPAFWTPALEVSQIVYRTLTDIEYQVYANTKEELTNCLNSVTMEMIQKAWDTYCQARDRSVSLVPLSIVVRCYGFDDQAPTDPVATVEDC